MDPLRLRSLEQQLQDAIRFESGVVDRVRATLTDVSWLPVPATSSRAVIAVVAADGGNIELRLRPFRIAFVRVGTSETSEPVGELFFPAEVGAAELAQQLEWSVPSCIDPLVAAGVDIERVLDSAGTGSRVHSVRELLEWGAVLAAVQTRRDRPVLVIRDGLLRSIHFRTETMGAIEAALRDAMATTGNQLAAVAKSVPGGSELLNLLVSAGVFDTRAAAGDIAALRVPKDLERQVFPGSFTAGRALGDLVLVSRRGLPTLTPIEVMDVDGDALLDVVAALHGPGVDWYPAPGMPAELQVAHANAHVSSFEQELLRASFLDAVHDLNPAFARRVVTTSLLGAGGITTEAL